MLAQYGGHFGIAPVRFSPREQEILRTLGYSQSDIAHVAAAHANANTSSATALASNAGRTAAAPSRAHDYDDNGIDYDGQSKTRQNSRLLP